MNILVTDAFSSSNRGDAAILDGILTGLRARLDADIGVVSHFPGVTSHFHGVPAIADTDPVSVATAIGRADLVVSCGGSFLHELYALNLHPRLATIHLCARLGKPVVPFAQTFGPFRSPLGRTAAREALDDTTWIVARDEASARTVRDLGVRTPVHQGVDAAILGATTPMPRGSGPRLGVTARAWHFPDGGDQATYERAMAEAMTAWTRATDGEVVFYSTCTGLGGYRQDDRETARRIAAQVPGATVEEREDLGFAEVRGQLAACDMVVGTRMHSLIFATTAGVPAVGVAYEGKTAEWLAQVGLAGRHVDIERPQALGEVLAAAWEARDELRERVAERLPGLRAAAGEQLDRLVAIARGERPVRERVRVARGAGWDKETWRYDVAHRRLRVVADTVLAQGGERVLDLGCSTGMLGRMLGPTYDYTGLDAAPSVAADRERFRIRTASLDGEWPVEGRYDVVVASGALEYVEDLGGVLRKMRSAAADGALVVATHVNLAHVSRLSRHPDWRSHARPDDFVLALWEAGLVPTWIGASSAGYGPAPAVDAEGPTDHDLDGGGQLGIDRLVRLAHHLVVACRAGEARPGPEAMGRFADAGDFLGAARIGLELVRRFPWAARAWADLGVVMHLGGRVEEGARYLGRALQLDPARPDAVENAAAIGLVWEPATSEGRAIVTGDWRTVALELAAAGRPHAALRGRA